MSDDIIPCPITIAVDNEDIIEPLYNEVHGYMEIFANNKNEIIIPPRASQIVDIPTYVSFSIPEGAELHITNNIDMIDNKLLVFGSPIILGSYLCENMEIPLINYSNRNYIVNKGDLIAVARVYENCQIKIEKSELRLIRGDNEN